MCPAPIASGGRGRHARLRPWAGPRVGALPQLPYTHTGHSVHSPSHPLVSSQCPSGCQVRRRVRARNRHPRRRAEAGCGGVVDEREDACGKVIASRNSYGVFPCMLPALAIPRMSGCATMGRAGQPQCSRWCACGCTRTAWHAHGLFCSVCSFPPCPAQTQSKRMHRSRRDTTSLTKLQRGCSIISPHQLDLARPE